MSATWPFAELSATREQLEISCTLLEPFVVTRVNVASITPFDAIPILGRGLRFEVGDRDEAIVFWTYRRSRIVRQLTSLGWTVDERWG